MKLGCLTSTQCLRENGDWTLDAPFYLALHVANIYFIFIPHTPHPAFWNLWIGSDGSSHCKCEISNSAHHHIITCQNFFKCKPRVFTKIDATHLITDIVNVPLWRGFLLFLSKKDPGIHVFRISVACNNKWNTKYSSWFIVTTVDCYSGQIILVYICEGSETYSEQCRMQNLMW